MNNTSGKKQLFINLTDGRVLEVRYLEFSFLIIFSFTYEYEYFLTHRSESLHMNTEKISKDQAKLLNGGKLPRPSFWRRFSFFLLIGIASAISMAQAISSLLS